jgi:hypothetical protein
MATTSEEDLHIVVVLSDEDFKAHVDGNELIDNTAYPMAWQRDHHECTFKALSNRSPDEQMREVLPTHDTH